MARKPLSKRLRFQVLKRDDFKCAYCGRAAPDVELHVDHIDPVANGGSDDLLNLVTSCAPCNLGKGAEPLDSNQEMERKLSEIQNIEARAEELTALRARNQAAEKILEEELAEISDRFAMHTGYGVSDVGARAVRRWLNQYNIEQVVSAVESAAETYAGSLDGSKDFNMMFDKVPAILKHRKEYGAHSEAFRKLAYAEGILRNRGIDGWEHLYYGPCSDLFWMVTPQTADNYADQIIERAKSIDDYADLSSAISTTISNLTEGQGESDG